MLTPRFELSQTEDEVTIIIHAPYANIKDTLVEVNGADFRFYSTPYYLRLNLPGEIEENDTSKGDYNCDQGDFTFKFSKLHKGEYFENLDMITSLLVPPKKIKNQSPMIEIISNPCTSEEEQLEQNEEKSDEEDSNKAVGNEWYMNQTIYAKNIQLPLHVPTYGFANKISGALAAFEDAWIKEIIDLPSPDKTLAEDRIKLQRQCEFESFNEEHYMADLVEPELIKPYISYECPWEKITDIDVLLTDDEKDLLKELPNKEYLIDENEMKIVLHSMIDILFASCYNCRITLGENTVESAWTVNKLSSTLSWFQTFSNLSDVFLSSIRRSLCYPQIRNWDLSQKVIEDLKKIVKLGKKYIIKLFCEIHSLFNNSYEPRYILNQLYIKDYLIWLQKIPNSVIEELYPAFANINIEKKELELDIVELEEAVIYVQQENLVIQNELYLPNEIEKLIIGSNNSSSLFHDYDELDSDDSSSSSSSSSSTSSSSNFSCSIHGSNDSVKISRTDNKSSSSTCS